ncbi:4a-hydroxytetrahydrobiopterin dehydratase [Armatimonas sp.]|uniref:4a-hydroxytetrahydrobiopterin dehydratase n=1 Tax=Armatimonas sp. TaxID=1872638 RepID=UPI0037526D34
MKVLKLSAADVQAALAVRSGWSLDKDTIVRTFVFADFLAAMRFVNAIAEAAQTADHHPDIDIRYNKVTLALTTHDSGGLTEKDFALAAQADTLAT